MNSSILRGTRVGLVAIVLATAGLIAPLQAHESTGALERCLQAALAQKQGTIVKLEVETAETSTESYKPAKGTPLFEIEVRTNDGTEWEFTCEESSGKIAEIEHEVPAASHAEFVRRQKVTEAQAREAALKSVPGKIVEVEYEIEADRAATYEFDIEPQAGDGEWKVEVDATSGKVVESRRELYQVGEEASSASR